MNTWFRWAALVCMLGLLAACSTATPPPVLQTVVVPQTVVVTAVPVATQASQPAVPGSIKVELPFSVQ